MRKTCKRLKARGLTVDATAAGTLKMTLMIALRFSTMNTVANRFARKLLISFSQKTHDCANVEDSEMTHAIMK